MQLDIRNLSDPKISIITENKHERDKSIDLDNISAMMYMM